jgi:hypothetical protein
LIWLVPTKVFADQLLSLVTLQLPKRTMWSPELHCSNSAYYLVRIVLLVEVEDTLRLTVSQSVSQSWYRLPLWDLRPDIISCPNAAVWNVRSCIYWAPSLTRGRVRNLQCNHSIVRVTQKQKPYFTLIWDSPNLGGQFPIFISPGNRVAQLYPRAPGSLYVVSYDSQGNGGGILTLPLPGGTGPCIYSLQE